MCGYELDEYILINYEHLLSSIFPQCVQNSRFWFKVECLFVLINFLKDLRFIKYSEMRVKILHNSFCVSAQHLIQQYTENGHGEKNYDKKATRISF